MVVEIPKGSSNKYEYSGELAAFRLDRVLYSPVHYPGDYGFIPGTLASDGDPMDVLALVEEPTFTGCIVEVRPVGVHLLVRREQGECVVTGYQFRRKEWSLDGLTGSIEQEMPIHWIDHNPSNLEPDSLPL